MEDIEIDENELFKQCIKQAKKRTSVTITALEMDEETHEVYSNITSEGTKETSNVILANIISACFEIISTYLKSYSGMERMTLMDAVNDGLSQIFKALNSKGDNTDEKEQGND